MSRRQIPETGLPAERLDSLIASFERFFDSNWLRYHPEHPAGNIWKRRDFIASIEILTFGAALEALEKSASAKMQREYRRLLRSPKLGDVAGAATEILLSYMFDTGSQKISLPKPGNPGYDLILTLVDGESYCISCKALTKSSHEIAFKQTAAACYEYAVEKATRTGKPFQLLIFPTGNTSRRHVSPRAVCAFIDHAFESWDARNPWTDNDPEWSIILAPERGLSTTHKLYSDAQSLSHTFIMWSHFSTDEQSRFNFKLYAAAKNISRAVGQIPDNCRTAIIIKLPFSVSIGMAKSWLQSILKSPALRTITRIFLYRSAMLFDDKIQARYLNHEFESVSNPYCGECQSTSQSSDSIFEMRALVGKREAQDPRAVLMADNRALDLSYKYVFQEGKHYYADSVAGSVSFDVRNQTGIQTFLILSGPGQKAMTMEAITPENDELLLI